MTIVGSVMIYVTDPRKVANFWIEVLDFKEVEIKTPGPIQPIELIPSTGAQTHIVFFEKKVIAQMQPELDLGMPSLMFKTDDFDGFYNKLKEKNITTGDLIDMGGSRIINFSDPEGNYFAVEEELK